MLYPQSINYFPPIVKSALFDIGIISNRRLKNVLGNRNKLHEFLIALHISDLKL